MLRVNALIYVTWTGMQLNTKLLRLVPRRMERDMRHVCSPGGHLKHAAPASAQKGALQTDGEGACLQ